MALRTATRVGSDTGTIGRRNFSSILPSSDRAYFTGDGLDSMKRLVCSGISFVVQLERGWRDRPSASQVKFRAQPRRDVGSNRDATVAAMRHVAEYGWRPRPTTG